MTAKRTEGGAGGHLCGAAGCEENCQCGCHREPRIVAECWTCGAESERQESIWYALSENEAEKCRAAGHDVMDVKGREGKDGGR